MNDQHIRQTKNLFFWEQKKVTFEIFVNILGPQSFDIHAIFFDDFHIIELNKMHLLGQQMPYMFLVWAILLLISLAKWLSVHLGTKWLWVGIPLLSLKLQVWCLLRARSSFTFKQTTKSRFTLRLVRDMIITYNSNVFYPIILFSLFKFRIIF